MTAKVRASLLSLTIITVIVFSAFGTTTVYADDGGTTPEPPPTEITTDTKEVNTEATTPSTETTAEEATAEPKSTDVAEATATPEPVTTDPVSTEVSTDTVSAEATSAPESTEVAAPTVDASVLTAVPDNTTVTVLDANGQEQPLATQAAAEAVATSDPVWCPASAGPGDATCTPSFSSFTALLSELQAHPELYAGAGTIYVEQGAYTGSDPNNLIDFNAYNLSAISGADLTVNGGWDPVTNAIDPAAPSTLSNTRLLIGSSTTPWGGSLVLTNLSLDYTNPGPNLPATPESALALYSQGNITLLNVSVTDAPDTGADVNAGGNVNVIDSKFDRNQTTGARIRAGGGVAVVNSSFSNPATGRRQDVGLDIQNSGTVTLVSVLANENRQAGTSINTGGQVAITSSFFSGTKLVQGSNFLGYGLQVVTPTTVSLVGVTANDNFLWGANLQAGGNIAISDSVFNANTTASPGFIDDTGLFITGGGTVDLTNVTANDNRLYGAQINAVGGVAIHNSTFSNNRGVITTGGTTTYHGHGLQITSQGDISLDGVTATNNMLFGAQLNAGGNVGVAFSTFSDTSTGSSANALGKGLEVISAGDVAMSDVVLNNNQTVGADIKAGGNVTLTDLTVTGNGTDGILLQGVCASLSGGTYSGNGGYGLNLGSTALDLVTQPTFGSNQAGDLFPTTPAVCSLLLLNSGNVASGATTAAAPAAFNVFVALETAPQLSADTSGASASAQGTSDVTSADVTLKSIMVKSANSGLQRAFFAGKYSYVYSSAGLQIFALASSDERAMGKTFRAY